MDIINIDTVIINVLVNIQITLYSRIIFQVYILAENPLFDNFPIHDLIHKVMSNKIINQNKRALKSPYLTNGNLITKAKNNTNQTIISKNSQDIFSKPANILFHQSHANALDEYELVQVATSRQVTYDKLVLLIQKTNNDILIHQEPWDDITVFKFFRYLNNIRLISLEMIECVERWNIYSYTHRPILFRCDYIIKMIQEIGIANTASIKKVLNFHIDSGNIFLLPIQSQASSEINQLKEFDEKTVLEIRIFSNINEELKQRIAKAYDALHKYLTSKELELVFPLSKWQLNPWIPNIRIKKVIPRSLSSVSVSQQISSKSIIKKPTSSASHQLQLSQVSNKRTPLNTFRASHKPIATDIMNMKSKQLSNSSENQSSNHQSYSNWDNEKVGVDKNIESQMLMILSKKPMYKVK